MALRDIIDKLKEMKNNEEPKEEIPDDVTRDKHLRSLRRMRRIQDEETEKEQLIKDIADFNRQRTKRQMFGIKEGMEKKVNEKKFEILKDKVSILKGKKKIESKGKMGFLGKTSL